MTARSEPTLKNLPTSVWRQIIDYATDRDVASIRATCNDLYNSLPYCLSPQIRLSCCETRNVLHVNILHNLHRGTAGNWFKVLCKEDQEVYALARVRLTEVRYYSLREIAALKLLSHPNIVSLKCISLQSKQIMSLFPYIPDTLGSVLRDFRARQQRFSYDLIRKWMKELLAGLAYCHQAGVMHRNITPKHLLLRYPQRSNNIEDAVLQISGFSLTRILRSETESLTTKVVTLWYRAPELLLGQNQYSPKIDVWSAGCIYAQLLRGSPLFVAYGEIDMLFRIFQYTGAPDEQHWPGVTSLPHFAADTFPRFPWRSSPSLAIREAQERDREVLDACLTLSPKARMSASQALALLSQSRRPSPALSMLSGVDEEARGMLEKLLARPETSAVATQRWRMCAERYVQWLRAEQKSLPPHQRRWAASPTSSSSSPASSPGSSLYPDGRPAIYGRMSRFCQLLESNHQPGMAILNRCWLLYDLACLACVQYGDAHFSAVLGLAVLYIICKLDLVGYPSLETCWEMYFGQCPEDSEEMARRVVASEAVVLSAVDWRVYLPSVYDYWKLAMSVLSEDTAASMRQMVRLLHGLPFLCVACRQAALLDRYPQVTLATSITALLWTAIWQEKWDKADTEMTDGESQGFVPYPSQFTQETGLLLDEEAVQAAKDILSTERHEVDAFWSEFAMGMERSPPTTCMPWQRLLERAR